MLLYHVAGALLLFRYIFRDPKVDVRFLVLGALLPNLIDKPLGTIFAPDFFGADRLVGHSLLFATLLMVVTLLATRRGRRRRALMAVAIGSFLHLVLDGMWTSTETFLWPLFGTNFEPGMQPFWSAELFTPLAIVQELGAALYLWYLWKRTNLADPNVRQEFRATGRLPA